MASVSVSFLLSPLSTMGTCFSGLHDNTTFLTEYGCICSSCGTHWLVHSSEPPPWEMPWNTEGRLPSLTSLRVQWAEHGADKWGQQRRRRARAQETREDGGLMPCPDTCEQMIVTHSDGWFLLPRHRPVAQCFLSSFLFILFYFF